MIICAHCEALVGRLDYETWEGEVLCPDCKDAAVAAHNEDVKRHIKNAKKDKQ